MSYKNFFKYVHTIGTFAGSYTQVTTEPVGTFATGIKRWW